MNEFSVWPAYGLPAKLRAATISQCGCRDCQAHLDTEFVGLMRLAFLEALGFSCAQSVALVRLLRPFHLDALGTMHAVGPTKSASYCFITTFG